MALISAFPVAPAIFSYKLTLRRCFDPLQSACSHSVSFVLLNGYEDICKFDAVNAFDVLKLWVKEGRRYDTVILDPPAFTKSRENIQKAITGYKEINLRAMKLVRPGGFLVTASCTNLVPPDMFLNIINMAAKDAKRTLRQVEWRTQASDHPILFNVPTTQYLKFLIVEVQ